MGLQRDRHLGGARTIPSRIVAGPLAANRHSPISRYRVQAALGLGVSVGR
jgi:hypothetical protein